MGERRGKTRDSELGISQKGHDSKPARDPLQVSNLNISRQCQMFINDVVTKIMLTDTWLLKEIEWLKINQTSYDGGDGDEGGG